MHESLVSITCVLLLRVVFSCFLRARRLFGLLIDDTGGGCRSRDSEFELRVGVGGLLQSLKEYALCASIGVESSGRRRFQLAIHIELKEIPVVGLATASTSTQKIQHIAITMYVSFRCVALMLKHRSKAHGPGNVTAVQHNQLRLSDFMERRLHDLRQCA